MKYLTETVNLTGPCGHLGTIRAVDLWQLRESREAMVEGVATIASLSYGNDAAKNPEALFNSIIERGHLSCLEFVPIAFSGASLPFSSFRHCPQDGWTFGEDVRTGPKKYPATAFLVEAPILTVRQWFRHRSFSYLEMSRRYVKASKVPFEFYGSDNADVIEQQLYDKALETYDHLIANGEPPERARRVIPVGAMTKFWAGGFNRDWRESFTRLRSEKHAQEEIRLFSNLIEKIVS